jgi:hypothetical protein
MTKISAYPILTNPTEDDILIGTDVNSSDETRNFSIGSIIGLIGDINQGPIGPQGNTGPTGPQGPVGPAGLEWQGSWVSGTSYVADDAVGYDGASYFCILATSGTTTPNLATANWALLASQGAVGPTGPAGPIGPQGPGGGALPYKSFVSFIQFTSDGTPLSSSIYNDFEPGISFIQNSTGVYEMSSFISPFTTKTVIIPFDKITGNPAKVRLPIFNFSPGVIIGYYTIQRWNNNNVRIHFWDTSNNLVNPFTLLGSSNILVDIKIYN